MIAFLAGLAVGTAGGALTVCLLVLIRIHHAEIERHRAWDERRQITSGHQPTRDNRIEPT